MMHSSHPKVLQSLRWCYLTVQRLTYLQAYLLAYLLACWFLACLLTYLHAYLHAYLRCCCGEHLGHVDLQDLAVVSIWSMWAFKILLWLQFCEVHVAQTSVLRGRFYAQSTFIGGWEMCSLGSQAPTKYY
jgi:hypothetical protein